jgi:hypothetical protein
MFKFLLAVGGMLTSVSLVHAADGAAGPSDPAAAAAPAWTSSFASEMRYYAWRSNRGSPTTAAPDNGRAGGSQLYIPYALEVVGQLTPDLKVELVGRGGYVWARQTTPGLVGQVETTTDTVASGTFTYLGLNGLQPFFALSVNLPTGKAALIGSSANARMDPDLVELSSFGEGTNLGPTVGVNVPLTTALLATFSAGYTWRGRFDREDLLVEFSPFGQRSTSLDPGDNTTVTAALAYASGPVSARLTGSVSTETITFQDGVALYRAGTRFLLSGSLSYAWPETWGVSSINISGAHAEKNDVRFLSASALVTEPINTNSNVYRIGLQHLFALGQFAAGPVASYLLRDRNGYDTTTLQFVPQKQRYSAGLLAQYSASQRITFNTRIEHVWTHEDDNPALGGRKFSVLANAFLPGSAVPVVSSAAWQGVVGVNVSF